MPNTEGALTQWQAIFYILRSVCSISSDPRSHRNPRVESCDYLRLQMRSGNFLKHTNLYWWSQHSTPAFWSLVCWPWLHMESKVESPKSSIHSCPPRSHLYQACGPLSPKHSEAFRKNPTPSCGLLSPPNPTLAYSSGFSSQAQSPGKV